MVRHTYIRDITEPRHALVVQGSSERVQIKMVRLPEREDHPWHSAYRPSTYVSLTVSTQLPTLLQVLHGQAVSPIPRLSFSETPTLITIGLKQHNEPHNWHYITFKRDRLPRILRYVHEAMS